MKQDLLQRTYQEAIQENKRLKKYELMYNELIGFIKKDLILCEAEKENSSHNKDNWQYTIWTDKNILEDKPYKIKYESGYQEITFDLQFEELEVKFSYDGIKTIKAIQKQIEELNWESDK